MGYDGRVPEPERRVRSDEWDRAFESLLDGDDGGWDEWGEFDAERYTAAIEVMMDGARLVPVLLAVPCTYCGTLTNKAEMVGWVPCPVCDVCRLVSPTRRQQLRGW